MPTYDELMKRLSPKLQAQIAENDKMAMGSVIPSQQSIANPAKLAALAALSGENPITAMQEGAKAGTKVEGRQVVNRAFDRLGQAGLPTPEKNEAGDYNYAESLGQGLDTGLDMIQPGGPGGAAMGSMKLLKAEAPAVSEAAKRIAARFGKTEAAIAPKMASGALTEAEQLGQKAIPLSSGEAYKKKIADLVEKRNQERLNAEMGDLMSKTDQPYMPANMKANNVRVKLEELAQKRADQIAARKKIAE